VLDVLVPEVVLQRPRVVAIVGELEPTGMAQHVRVEREWHLAASPMRWMRRWKPMRAILAKHIIAAAKDGERDHSRLRDGALLALTQSNLRRAQ
jgi:hypothetical protein